MLFRVYYQFIQLHERNGICIGVYYKNGEYIYRPVLINVERCITVREKIVLGKLAGMKNGTHAHKYLYTYTI